MIIKKGQLLKIGHRRKGTFIAVALRDFEIGEETWFPVALAEGRVKGISTGLGTDWVAGDEIPCRASLVSYIEPAEVEEKQCNPEP